MGNNHNRTKTNIKDISFSLIVMKTDVGIIIIYNTNKQ